MPKKLPKDRQTNADKVNRGRELSRSNDVTKNMNVGLLDIDSAIFYYFEHIIKPTVISNGDLVDVPVIYGSGERWKLAQKDGFYRDKNQKWKQRPKGFITYE